jgi:hypothetical protein
MAVEKNSTTLQQALASVGCAEMHYNVLHSWITGAQTYYGQESWRNPKTASHWPLDYKQPAYFIGRRAHLTSKESEQKICKTIAKHLAAWEDAANLPRSAIFPLSDYLPDESPMRGVVIPVDTTWLNNSACWSLWINLVRAFAQINCALADHEDTIRSQSVFSQICYEPATGDPTRYPGLFTKIQAILAELVRIKLAQWHSPAFPQAMSHCGIYHYFTKSVNTQAMQKLGDVKSNPVLALIQEKVWKN